MNRSRLALIASLVATGCAGIIGVPDLTYDQNAADGGALDGNVASQDGNVATGPDANAACNTDVSLDARNCGRCGHDCGAGTCTAGACQPYLLADGVSGIQELAVDSSYLYYAAFTDAAILRVKKDASSKAQPVVSSVAEATGVAVNGTTLYYTSQTNGFFQCTLTATGTCPGPKAVGHQDGQYYWNYISLSGAEVYYGSQDGAFRLLADGGDIPIRGSTTFNVHNIAASPGYVYWTSQAYELDRNLSDGGGPASEEKAGDMNSLTYPTYVAVNGDRYFWAYKDQTTNAGVVSSGSEANTADKISYTQTGTYPLGIAADAQYVYWSDRGDLVSADTSSAAAGNGRLLACPRGGCVGDPIVLADKLRGAGFIVLDDTTVYFAENNNFGAGGRIRAVAKP